MIPEPTPHVPAEEPEVDTEAGVRADVSLLIDALGATDRRLEELTDGQVDTVTDSAGQSFLLRRAQERWRQSGADKEAAILDSLPVQIVLLDLQGIIVATNAAWRMFADEQDLKDPHYGVGRNYLTVCDRAAGQNDTHAARVAEGIRSILAGKSRHFSDEYRCELPSRTLWFQLSVAPLGDGNPTGALVMHVDVTARKQHEEDLLLFAAAMDTTPDGLFLIDRAEMRLVHANQAGCRMHNLEREALLEKKPWEILRTTRAALEDTYDALIVAGGFAEPEVQEWERPPAGRIWVEIRRHARKIGGRWIIVAVLRDVTARKRADMRIAYLNRVHAVLSGINSLIVRVRDRDELYRGACRIVVDQGALAMTWIGMVDPANNKLVAVASAEMDEELLDNIQRRLDSHTVTQPGDSLPPRVVKEKRAFVSNDSQNDPRVIFKEIHVKIGIHSMAIIPLIVDEQAIGMLVLYARERDFFHAEQMKLLTELAGDVAFALAQIEKQERLDYLAYYDVLTGLANRSLFIERVSQHLRTGAGRKLAVWIIDLERFKNINDSLGRAAGDSLLRQLARRLTDEFGDAAMLARIDTDRFAVVTPAVESEDEVARRLEQTLKSIQNTPFQLTDADYRVAAKAGVALYPDDGADADTLFKNAEAALKKAKAGGDRYLFYAHRMTEAVAGRLNLENKLRKALELDEYVLHYQPKFDSSNRRLVGAEALIRWNDPATGLVAPGRFIPILEETGLIHEVGRFALKMAVKDHLRWRREGLPAVRLAVNLSALQLRHRDFVAEIKRIIEGDPHAAAGLELEITESLIMEDLKISTAKLQAVRSMGVQITLDDFGTGFSSLSYLTKLPVDTVKIDRSFVTDMVTGPEGLSLVSIIINLAHSLKLKAVAEGVETEEQSRLLRLLNCDEMQGYLLGKPMPVDDFERLFLIPQRADDPGSIQDKSLQTLITPYT